MGLKGKEILIVDDMNSVRKTVKLILESEGAVVVEADTVDRGLATATLKVPHLIITDLNIPGKSGFDFLKERRKSETLVNIPTIVLSGLNDKASVVEAIALGASDYLLKPIRSTILLQKVRKRLKDESFRSFHFAEERPSAEVSLSVDIVKVSEVGFQIDAAVKFASDDTVTLSGDLLTDLECTDVITRTGKSSFNPVSQGRYLNDLNFVGVLESKIKRMRNRIKEWK